MPDRDEPEDDHQTDSELDSPMQRAVVTHSLGVAAKSGPLDFRPV